MGSVLEKFYFPTNSKWILDGPISKHIQSEYDYEFIESNHKNYKGILVLETTNSMEGVENILKELNSFILKNKNLKILAVSVADPSTERHYESLNQYIKRSGLNKNNIYFIDSNNRFYNNPNTLVYDYFIEEASLYFHTMFAIEKNDLNYISKEIEVDELNTFRNKKFLSFNRCLDKHHRLSLYHDYLHNDFSDSYFSFLLPVKPHCSVYHGDIVTLSGELYNKHLPIELDTKELDRESLNNFSTGNTFDKKLFLDSCIHLVSETSFDDNELFVSEKVLKPIINFQPFIAFSGYGYLKHLHELGFKTFGDFWDESYDLIENPSERYFKIMDVVFDLNNKSIEYLNEIYQKTKNICIYNREVFENFKTDTLDIFLKNNFNEK